jgi:hypothetical protein
MKKLIVLLLLLAHGTFLSAQSIEKYRILLTGASFASEPNTWFEIGCEALAARPVNRAIGGEAIANTANRMADGTLYSAEELEHIDAFVIMQVHEQDVYDESQLKENYEDYTLPFDRSNYAAAFDYVIKRYISECYKLKDKPGSRYYGTPYGKPAIIVLSTHWHDARDLYNSSVRRLAAKWGLPVIEFDKNIGFSKNTLHPVTKEQYSLIFSRDKQQIAGTVYGWHPERGRDAYIQQRMAAIFADKMRGILPLR